MEPPARKRGLWTLQQLQAAMAAAQCKVMSVRAAAVAYSIPRRTLTNHLKSGKVEKKIGRPTILTAEQENDLANRIKRLASIGFPLTTKVLRHQAYIFCVQHNVPNNFSQISRRAGKDWLKLFLKRHPDISQRKVQILNPGRAQKLNKPIVMHHFNEYQKIYEELDIGNHPQRLYNMDEKGCRLTIHNQPMVLAAKGVKRVHMVAPEHAENVTVAACVSALGNTIPPMIIFKGKRLKDELKDNLPAGSLVKMAPKGSMTSTLFVDFINHLAKFKAAGRCLLVFDGASCHLDYTIVEAADKHDIVLYCLPSNTTHELQPLDKSVNKSFEHHWDQETLSFFYQNPEKKLTKTRFNSIFTKVWSKCTSHENIVNGFRATGLYPYNPEAIPEEAYAPSVLTERPMEQETVQKSPEPGSSGMNLQHAFDTNSSDSDITFCEDLENTPLLFSSVPGPSGLNLLHSLESSDSPLMSLQDSACTFPTLMKNIMRDSSITGSGIQRPLVDYSSSDCDCDSPILAEPKLSDSVIRRPIIYSSSESDTPISFTSRQTRPQFIHDIYTSSDDENADPILQQNRTPKKQMVTLQHNSSSNDESEDNIPLATLKAKKYQKSPFQQLIPTPNFAVVKQNKPRRKAINYKATVVSKDLFKERDTRKTSAKKYKAKERNLQPKKDCNKKKKKKSINKKSRSNNNTDDDKWYCHACETESCEDMHQCPVCQKWFHDQCVGLTKEDLDFDCPLCN